MAHETEPPLLARALDIVRERTGLDFAGYRRPTLIRRVHTRMITVNARTMAEYIELLEHDPDEAGRLMERLLIKVSRFFRDAHTFDALRRALVRRHEQRSPTPLRIWSAGCGHGEEAYSLAGLLDELGPAASGSDVIGTDVDARALSFAGAGVYPPSSMDGVTEEVRSRHFDVEGTDRGRVFRAKPGLRRRVALRFHDVTASTSPPDPRRFDLICCRNLLIYLEPALQERVETLLARSLLPGGLLCLGEAEWLLPRVARHFEIVDRKARLFRRRDESSGAAS